MSQATEQTHKTLAIKATASNESHISANNPEEHSILDPLINFSLMNHPHLADDEQ